MTVIALLCFMKDVANVSSSALKIWMTSLLVSPTVASQQPQLEKAARTLCPLWLLLLDVAQGGVTSAVAAMLRLYVKS